MLPFKGLLDIKLHILGDDIKNIQEIYYMHVLFSFLLLLIAIKWGNWKELNHNLDTLWYVASMNLLYLVIVDDYNMNPSGLLPKS